MVGIYRLSPICYCPEATHSPAAPGRLWLPASLPGPLALMCGSGCPQARLLLLWPGLHSHWVPGGMSCLQCCCSRGWLPCCQPQVVVPSCSAEWLPLHVCRSRVYPQPVTGGGPLRPREDTSPARSAVSLKGLAGSSGADPTS